MRRKRVKIEGRAAVYHVVNRVHGKEFLFGEEEAEAFCRIMRKVARFSGVEVITYCVMSNHFHLLVRVPKQKAVSDKEMFARYKELAAASTFHQLHRQFELFEEAGNELGMEQVRGRLTSRMYDLSAFMKELKQRFTQWYNTKNDCWGRGSFWTDRYKSSLVEGKGYAVATVAAYIDLNPIRAKMVDDPKDHRWCGYAAAMAGNPPAVAGLKMVLRQFLQGKGGDDLKNALAMYRMLLFGTAQRRYGSITREQIEAVFAAEGVLPSWKVAAHRARWMSDGLIIGGKEFVGQCARTWNEALGLKRKKTRQLVPDEVGWCRLRGT